MTAIGVPDYKRLSKVGSPEVYIGNILIEWPVPFQADFDISMPIPVFNHSWSTGKGKNYQVMPIRKEREKEGENQEKQIGLKN